MTFTDQKNLGGMKLGDCVNYLEEKFGAELDAVLPELPESDGTYTLQLTMDDGTATLSWETLGE